MTLLTIVQNAAKRTRLFESPAFVVGNNTDETALAEQLIIEVGEELKKAYNWEFQTREQTFNTVASQSKYELSTIISDDDFAAFVGNTMYDRTNNRYLQVIGTAGWQARQSVIGLSAGVTKTITIFDNAINVYPTPSSVDTYVFNYQSAYWIKDGSTRIATFSSDSNTFTFNEHLLYLGLVYKLRQAYGMPYEDELLAYEQRANAEAENNRIKQTIGQSWYDNRFAVNIPDTGFGQ